MSLRFAACRGRRGGLLGVVHGVVACQSLISPLFEHSICWHGTDISSYIMLLKTGSDNPGAFLTGSWLSAIGLSSPRTISCLPGLTP